MALNFELNRPGITSVSVDGIEHRVDPATGYLEVQVMTPNLMKELTTHYAAVQVDPNASRAQPRAMLQRPPLGSPPMANPPPENRAGGAIGGTGSGLDAARMASEASTEGAGLKSANQLPPQGDQQPAEQPSQQRGNLPGQLTAEEEAERQALFTELDETLGTRVDRRRSLNQLREMKEKGAQTKS
jgi:hypothetical protein